MSNRELAKEIEKYLLKLGRDREIHGDYREILEAIADDHVFCALGAFNGERATWMLLADEKDAMFPSFGLTCALVYQCLEQANLNSVAPYVTVTNDATMMEPSSGAVIKAEYIVIEDEELIAFFLSRQDGL